MRVLLIAFLLTSFAFLPEKNVENTTGVQNTAVGNTTGVQNTAVGTNEVSSNFEICREILYTTHPKEINPKEWRMCMNYET